MTFSSGVKLGVGIACGGCGAIVIVFVGLTMLGVSSLEHKKELRKAVSASNTGDAVNNKWVHREYEYGMGGKILVESLYSNNKVNLSSPYSGEQSGNVLIRKHPKEGLDVSFSVEKGQIVSSFHDEHLMIKFDNGAPIKYSTVKSADSSSELVFIKNSKSFIDKLKGCKTFAIEATFFQNGTHVFQFSNNDLDLSRIGIHPK